jgi:hypothetical protein
MSQLVTTKPTDVISVYKPSDMALLTSDQDKPYNGARPSFFVVTLTANTLLETVDLKIQTEKFLRNMRTKTNSRDGIPQHPTHMTESGNSDVLDKTILKDIH